MLNRGRLEGRIDADFYKLDYLSFREYLESLSAVRIKELILSFNRGDGPRDGFYTHDASGVYFLRVNNLKENTIDLTDVKLINRHVHEKTLKRTQVTAGDVVFAVSGTKENLGTISIIPDHIKEANLNSAILKLNLDIKRIDTAFFALFFDTEIALRQINMIGKGAAQNNLNSQEVFSIRIPLPNLERQREIVEWFKTSKAIKDAKDAEARAKFNIVESFVQNALGITLPEQTENALASRMFFTKSGILSGGRTDPDAQHPERIKAIKAVSSSKYPVEPLYLAAKFVSVQTDSKPVDQPYLGLNSIQSNTGIYTPKINEPEEFGTANIFKKDHVLFPKLRPYLNKVFYAGFDGVCSTEFHVLNGVKVSSQFLAIFLRTGIVVNQTKRLMTGNTLPRLQTSDIESLLIPIPPPDVQADIVEKVNAIYAEAKQLRDEGTAILESAKAEVERMILGES